MIEFIEYVKQIDDPRQQGKVRHKLSDIILLVILGTLVDANTWVKIADFAKHYRSELEPYLSLENGTPSHDTIQRVMGMLNPRVTAHLMLLWNEMTERGETQKLKKILSEGPAVEEPQKIINIDGKTIRGNQSKKQKAAHVVSAYSHEDGICFGQEMVHEKSNEITAIPKLLEQIQVKGAVITIDAMGTQTAIAEQIKKAKGDYVLAVKENQKSLLEEVRDYLMEPFLQQEIRDKGGYHKTVDNAHGQIETREYYQTDDVKWMTQKTRWAGLKSIGMVHKTIEKDGEKKTESRFYISTLKADPVNFARCVRGHWAIESMHWHLDVTFGEDADKTLDKTAALNHSNIRKLCLAILRQLKMGNEKMSLDRKRFALTVRLIDYLDQLFSV